MSCVPVVIENHVNKNKSKIADEVRKYFKSCNSKYQVGQEIIAQWQEDKMWYRAQILERVEGKFPWKAFRLTKVNYTIF